MGFFKPKTEKKKADPYYEIICMNTACMKKFTHDQRLFQLDPPQEVDNYRRNKLLNTARASVKTEKIKNEYDLDDLDDDETRSETASSASAFETRVNSEMEEKVKYYYDNGDIPRCIPISETSAPVNLPHIQKRLYLQDNEKTCFVVGILDKYGKRTYKAVCPHCLSEGVVTRLYPGAGLYKPVIVPVLGVSQSGKSVLLSNGLAPFLKQFVPRMLPSGSTDQTDDVRKYIYDLEESIRKTSAAPATNEVKRLMWTLDSTEQRYALFTFDMPGEYIANSDENFREFREKDVANVLRNANGIIIIICPEQIENITAYNLDDDNDHTRHALSHSRRMRRIENMIRLLCEEVDPQRVLIAKKLPTCVLLTKLDMLKSDYNGAVDIKKINSEAVRREVENIIRMPEIDVVGGRVDMGPLDNASQNTRSLFEKLLPNEMNMIFTRLVGDRNMLGCFAVSVQGSDQTSDSNAAPIRPYDSFHWLFTKMNLFRRKEINAGRNN